MVTLNIIHQLVENKDNNMDILTGLDWVIVPVVNIDGYVHSHNVDRFWRKTRSLNPENPDCIGTDPNRNFNFQWDFPGGSSTNVCDFKYSIIYNLQTLIIYIFFSHVQILIAEVHHSQKSKLN